MFRLWKCQTGDRLPYHNQITPNLIWNVEQNKPSLIADDLAIFGISREITHEILLARGVYKWLSVRRQLIKIKNVWREKLTASYTNRRGMSAIDRAYQKGYARAIEECRSDVRAMCHSARWQAPDFDREANKYLSVFERQETT